MIRPKPDSTDGLKTAEETRIQCGRFEHTFQSKFQCVTNVCVLWPLRASFVLMLVRWRPCSFRRAAVAEMSVCVTFGARRSEATFGPFKKYNNSLPFYSISGRTGAEMTLYVTFGACWLYGLVARQGVPWRHGGDLEVRANFKRRVSKSSKVMLPSTKRVPGCQPEVCKKR